MYGSASTISASAASSGSGTPIDLDLTAVAEGGQPVGCNRRPGSREGPDHRTRPVLDLAARPDDATGAAADQVLRLEPPMDGVEDPLAVSEVRCGGEHDREVARGAEIARRRVGGDPERLDGIELVGEADADLDGRTHEADFSRYSRTKPSRSPSRTRFASPTS